jgi:hypothetical protein
MICGGPSLLKFLSMHPVTSSRVNIKWTRKRKYIKRYLIRRASVSSQACHHKPCVPLHARFVERFDVGKTMYILMLFLRTTKRYKTLSESGKFVVSLMLLTSHYPVPLESPSPKRFYHCPSLQHVALQPLPFSKSLTRKTPRCPI